MVASALDRANKLEGGQGLSMTPAATPTSSAPTAGSSACRGRRGASPPMTRTITRNISIAFPSPTTAPMLDPGLRRRRSALPRLSRPARLRVRTTHVGAGHRLYQGGAGARRLVVRPLGRQLHLRRVVGAGRPERGRRIADQPAIRRAVRWLTQVQNQDGGFGESTDDYIYQRYAPAGKSVPSRPPGRCWRWRRRGRGNRIAPAARQAGCWPTRGRTGSGATPSIRERASRACSTCNIMATRPISRCSRGALAQPGALGRKGAKIRHLTLTGFHENMQPCNDKRRCVPAFNLSMKRKEVRLTRFDRIPRPVVRTCHVLVSYPTSWGRSGAAV